MTCRGLIFAGLVSLTCAAEPTTLVGHKSRVADVEFSPDGKWLASLAENGETIVWNLEAQTGRRGPLVGRSLAPGGTWLQFTHETPPLLMAGCNVCGALVNPATAQAVSTWGDPQSKLGHAALIYAGGRRYAMRKTVLEVGRADALYAIGDRDPPLTAVSPDGTRWLTNRNMGVGNNTQVQVLDSAVGRVLCDLKSFTSAVKGVAWAGDGRVLTLIDGGSYGGSLMLWDVSGAGKLLAKADVPGGWRLAASADGNVAAVALRDNKVAVLDVGPKQLQPRATLNAGLWSETDPTFSLSHDGGRLLAASPSDNRWQLVVLDTRTGKELVVHRRQYEDGLPELSPQGDRVAIGHADGSISLLPVSVEQSGAGGGPLTQLVDLPLDHPSAPGMPEGIRNLYRPYSDGKIALSTSGEVIAVGAWQPDQAASVASTQPGGKHLPVWETTSTGPFRKTLPAWAMLADGTFLVEGTIVGQEKIPNFVSGRINPATGQFQIRQQHRPLQFTAMQPSPDGKWMAVRAAEWTFENNQRKQQPASLLLLDLQTGQTVRTLATSLETGTPCVLVFSQTGKRLAVLERWKLRVFDTDTGDEVPLAGEWRSTRFWFLDDGRILARRESNGSVVGVDLDTQAEAFRWNPAEGQTGTASAVQLSPDGKLAAVGGQRGDLTIRHPRTGAVLHRLQPFEIPVAAIGFSPDGTTLAAADEQRRLIAWKLGEFGASPPAGQPAAASRTIQVAD